MYLKEVHLKNFKSFQDNKINLNNINILVGKNNSGKSNLIESIDLFFNYRKKYRTINLDNYLFKNTSKKSTKLKFSITCIFKANKKIKIDVSRRVKTFEPINANNELRIRFSHNKSKQRLYSSNTYEIYNYSSAKYIRLSSIEFNRIFNNFEFLYIPAFRDFSNEHILEEIIGKLFDKSSAIKRNKIKLSLTKVKTNITNNIINSFTKDFNNLIDNDFFGKLELDILFKLNDRKFIQDILKSSSPVLTDDVQTDINDKGSGLQSFIIIWLYNYLSKLSNKKLILAIEEPEAHLHPTAQKNLMKGINTIFKSDNNQIIVTTHSPFLINSSKFESIISIQKTSRAKETISNIKQIKSDFFDTNDLNYFQRNLNIEKKDIFFSDHIILVEGTSDQLVLNHFLKLYGFDCNFNNCSIIPVYGKGNFKFLVKLISAFGLSYNLIFDRDFFYEFSNNKETWGFFNMCTYSNIRIPASKKQALITSKDNIIKLNKKLKEYNAISFVQDLEKDLMTNKTLTHFQTNLDDQTITLADIKTNNEHIKKIKRIIQIIAYDINQKIDLPQSYQRIINFLIKR